MIANEGDTVMKENTARLLTLIQKSQVKDLSLADSIELRRLSAEFANVCGEIVEKKMDQFYKK